MQRADERDRDERSAGHAVGERRAPEVAGQRGGHERGRDARDREVFGGVPLAEHELDPPRRPTTPASRRARSATAVSPDCHTIAVTAANATTTRNASGRFS